MGAAHAKGMHAKPIGVWQSVAAGDVLSPQWVRPAFTI
jgi:hypothetical protein